MNQGLLLWRSPCHNSILFPPSVLLFTTSLSIIPRPKLPSFAPIKAASLDSTLDTHQQQQQELTARERRKLRSEKRESKAGRNWREEVELKLIQKKPKKQPLTSTHYLDLNTLAHLGPRWWTLRVNRSDVFSTADNLTRWLRDRFPDKQFKIYVPSVEEKKRSRAGTISVKRKPVHEGTIFLHGILNKEIHDFIRESHGVGYFQGLRVVNGRKQIVRPRPVTDEHMEMVSRGAKEEQEILDRAFQEEQQAIANSDLKPKGRAKSKTNKLAKGSNVRVVSGTFAEFTGSIKKISRKTKKATVEFTIFGKESLVDLDLDELVAQ
ncbi:hypothetical protein Tsubulata_012573 [Turnera subulata]|uniref:KOW domain-containing protein n=1 Tax=Turnera subulata TaxID=218843 RepID=A0A9Q0FQB1_9ROSI|nr:hypothetical protein Tsubulata_012573 [Turnera subulata]